MGEKWVYWVDIRPGGVKEGRGRERQPTTSVPRREIEFW